MQIVPKAELAPGCCIVTRQDTGPFVDTGLTAGAFDRVYVSRQAAIDVGRHFFLPDPETHEELVEAVERLAKQVEHLEAQLAEADRYADAAEYTLKATFGDDTKIRNKPGRKPKETAK